MSAKKKPILQSLPTLVEMHSNMNYTFHFRKYCNIRYYQALRQSELPQKNFYPSSAYYNEIRNYNILDVAKYR